MTDYSAIARRVLDTEITALTALKDGLGAEFNTVVETLQKVKGRIILTGVGKSGHVARKIAATLSSTGTPALYIHPTEASHGDMGMITANDAVIALSRSGETSELANIVTYCQRFSVPLIAMTAIAESTLARAANLLLRLPDAAEACGETHAPTTSTTLQMALGDALAIALLEAKGFTASDFKSFHPGGALGAALKTITDIMHQGDALPLVAPDTKISDALAVMSEKGFGCVGVHDDGKFLGLFTDGDIRRNLSGDLASKAVTELITRTPKTCAPDELAADVLRRMTDTPPKVMQIFVLEKDKAIGIVHMHDFLRAGLV